ncbi:MAG TPA: hypothetical protein VKA51_14215, partial [Rubrobacteraceae bacterium]|nr:hypothetical protein [Rubrobacteraceae bacterium]
MSAALAILLAFSSAPAEGAVSYAVSGEFGLRDYSQTALGFSQSTLAVDEAAGNVLVADKASPGAKVYDPDAGTAPLFTFGAADRPAPDDIAVDQSDGSVYVSEFSRTEFQEVGAVLAVGGTYRLELEGEKTAPIPYDAGEEVVLAALEGLTSIGPGDVDIVFFSPGGVMDLAFKGALAFTNVDQVEVDASGLQDDG